MNDNMKQLVSLGEDLGYSLVRYSEFCQTRDGDTHPRFELVFEL